jgi:hypothetical protein
MDQTGGPRERRLEPITKMRLSAQGGVARRLKMLTY